MSNYCIKLSLCIIEGCLIATSQNSNVLIFVYLSMKAASIKYNVRMLCIHVHNAEIPSCNIGLDKNLYVWI